jgi:secreted trypsin-like serine protease
MLFLLVVASLIATCSAQTHGIWFDESCGKSKYANAGEMVLPPGQRMIVGGIEAQPNEFPWQVSIRTKSNQHYCGGIIINEMWILTASHCMDGDIPAGVSIVVGDHTRNQPSDVRQTLNVSNIFMHESYDPYWYYNDIALVKLETPIALNDEVWPVCAPDATDLYTYQKSQVSGWGTLSPGGACCPQTLQYVTVNITTNEYCDNAYPDDPVTSDMICATDNSGSNERDSCQGDSGGPLTVKEEDGRFVVVGIVSWGIGCASGWPGVYNRVGHFVDWVTDKLAHN